MLGLAVDLWIGVGAIVHGKSALEDDLPVGLCLDNSTDITGMPLTTTEFITSGPTQ